jgi:membrane protease YdiL (CAAX protease family)
MSADEAGIIGGAEGPDPASPGPGLQAPLPRRLGPVVSFTLEEAAWILLAVSVTALVAVACRGLGGRFAAAGPGATLFLLHGLVGLHVVRTEWEKLASWFRLDRAVLPLGLAGGAALLAFNAGYGMILDAAGIVPPNVVDELSRIAPMPVIFVWAVVFAPIVEELYFRGRLLEALDARVGRSWSGAVTSVLFAAAHGLPAFFPAYVALGLALLWLRRRTGGLIASIIAHAINNAVALLG